MADMYKFTTASGRQYLKREVVKNYNKWFDDRFVRRRRRERQAGLTANRIANELKEPSSTFGNLANINNHGIKEADFSTIHAAYANTYNPPPSAFLPKDFMALPSFPDEDGYKSPFFIFKAHVDKRRLKTPKNSLADMAALLDEEEDDDDAADGLQGEDDDTCNAEGDEPAGDGPAVVCQTDGGDEYDLDAEEEEDAEDDAREKGEQAAALDAVNAAAVEREAEERQEQRQAKQSAQWEAPAYKARNRGAPANSGGGGSSSSTVAAKDNFPRRVSG